MGFLTLLPILGIAFFFERRWRLPSAVALLHAVAWIVVALYAGGLIGALWWTALAIHLLGVGLLGYELLQRAKSPAGVSIPLPYALLIVLSGLFWLVHRHDQYFLYDEFAHWGIFLKDMLAFDDFWRADTNAMHARYLPGATLWQYLFNAFQEPTEGKAYFAHFVLLSAPLMILWSRLSWRQLPWALGILALCTLVLANFGLGISLYVDHVVGAWFVGTLLCYVSDQQMSWRRTAPYAALLIVLTLLKDVGLVFALAAAGMMATLTLRRAWTQHRNGRLALFGAVTAAVVLAAPSFAAAEAWSWNRDRVGAARDVKSVDSLLAGFVRSSREGDAAIEQELTRRFSEVFFHQQLSNDEVSSQFNEFTYNVRERFTDRYRLSTFGLFVAFTVWWIALLAFFLRGERRWTWGILAVGMLVTATGYVLLLYMSYRFAFGDRSLALPSYTRYVESVALPMVLLAFAPLLRAFRDPGPGPVVRLRVLQISAAAALFCGALVALYTFERPYLQPLLRANPQIALRRDFEPIASGIRGAVGDARVWIYLPQDRAELIGRVLQFLVSPTPATVERSDAFLEQGFDDVVARWSQFDYVWIPIWLDADTAKSLSHFAPGNPVAGLFRVRPDAEPGHALEPLRSDTRTRGTDLVNP